jgi:hypothetical protein
MKRYFLFLAAFVLVFAGQAYGDVFFDDFEESQLDSWWSKREVSGIITFPSTAQAQSGNQSVELKSLEGGDKSIQLSHDFAEPTYGSFSVWFYDAYAGDTYSNYVYLSLSNSVTHANPFLGVQDWDGGFYWEDHGTGQSQTSIPRTNGWHNLSILSLPDELTLKIDATVVYSGTNGIPFDRVALDLHGPSWRPSNRVAYFDDFQFVPVPEPSSLGLLSLGVISLLSYAWRRRQRAE